MQCYIYANCKKGFVKLFWKKDRSGYTSNLEEAGVYEDTTEFYTIYSKAHLKRLYWKKNRNDPKMEHLFIPVESIEDILGKKQTCIF